MFSRNDTERSPRSERCREMNDGSHQPMHLIQMLLPLHDEQKQKFSDSRFNTVREDLTQRFGGVTAFVRSPAVGLWKKNDEQLNRDEVVMDEVVMFEVMADQLDEAWWASYRKQLQEQFRQDEVLIWASVITKL